MQPTRGIHARFLRAFGGFYLYFLGLFFRMAGEKKKWREARRVRRVRRGKNTNSA